MQLLMSLLRLFLVQLLWINKRKIQNDYLYNVVVFSENRKLICELIFHFLGDSSNFSLSHASHFATLLLMPLLGLSNSLRAKALGSSRHPMEFARLRLALNGTVRTPTENSTFPLSRASPFATSLLIPLLGLKNADRETTMCFGSH